MDSRIQFFFIGAVILYLIIVFQMLKKQKLNLKYTLLWLFSGAILLIVTLFPRIMYGISSFVGIETPINSAFLLSGIFVIVILIAMTSIVSGLNKKLRVLVQEISILEKRVRELEHINEDEKE